MFGQKLFSAARPSRDVNPNDPYDPRQILADWVRHFGKTSIGTRSLPAHELAARTDSWAKHIVTGTPPPEGVEWEENARSYPALRRELIHYRNEEMDLARETEGEMREMVWDFANKLRAVVSQDQSDDQAIGEHIQNLANAARSTDLSTLKNLVSSCAHAVTEILAEREKRHHATLEQLSQRIAQMRQELSEAKERMVEDPLTGLFNRGALDSAIERYRNIALATGLPLSLLLIDLDHFKSVNDVHGHLAGDEVLRRAARCIIRAFPRKSDFLARYGGEEFAVLMPDTDNESALKVAERFVRTLAELDVDYDGSLIPVTCSVGLSTLEPSEEIADFIKRADTNLYRAKREGRNRAAA